MIDISPTAASKITELLAEENKEGSGLRVFVQGGGCSGFQYGLMIEEAGTRRRPGVRVERRQAVRRPHQRPLSRRRQVDFVDTVTGGGFTIKNPNAVSTCGCGSVVQHELSAVGGGHRRVASPQADGFPRLRVASPA